MSEREFEKWLVGELEEGFELDGEDADEETLRRELGRPIGVAMQTGTPAEAVRVSAMAAGQDLLIESLDKLFHVSRPPVELLRLVKDYAKSHLMTPGKSGACRATFRVIYVLTIAVALVRCGERISGLDDAVLRAQFIWASGLKALATDLRGVAREAAVRLSTQQTAGKRDNIGAADPGGT